MPHLYTLMAGEAPRTNRCYGLPSISAMTRTPGSTTTMMVGGLILVAPVFAAGARSRTLYLPRGGKHAAGWFHYWTQQFYAARRSPSRRRWIALFAGAGALIPMSDGEDDLAKTEEPSRALHYWLPRLAASGRHGSAVV